MNGRVMSLAVLLIVQTVRVLTVLTALPTNRPSRPNARKPYLISFEPPVVC